MTGRSELTAVKPAQPKRRGAHVQTTTILSVQGGLGNQLFEWGFAHALAARGARVVIDTVRCRGNRPLELGALLDGYPRLSRPLGLAAVLAQKRGLLAGNWAGSGSMRLVQEPGFSFDQGFTDGLLRPEGATNYVLGYFQSPKYFAGQEQEVRTKVSGHLHGMLTQQGKSFAAALAADPHSAAVHVRRGDYLSNPVAAAHHGSLQGSYYQSALSTLRDLGKHNVLWFSDDTDWVAAELARPGDTVATPALTAELTTGAGGEIALMAACSSRVIANSSFSWWAGWLGGDSTAGSPVIAPAQWFSGSPDPAADLVPGHWMRF
ncbi:alpha-1,2-fucosyltransferase [Specibacter sp. NPDC057265]|uniref:alpha-1,2-fucosyltransferase n=1 Tax=Specibacter sp. NPDC057265 TaxID=3346075 RepID=UPI0036362D9E